MPLGLQVFAACFLTVFLSELGDKTQLTILALGLRGDRLKVLAGSVAAFSIINGASSALGFMIYRLVPSWAVRLASGLAFITVGVAGLVRELRAGRRPREVRQEGREVTVLNSFALVGLSELGDKTQLATIGFSAATGLALLVALAAISALSLMATLTCALSSYLAGRLDKTRLILVSYVIFVAVGAWMMIWAI